MECYGRRYGRKDDCKTCELAPWCKDAGDPTPIADIDVDKVQVAAKKTIEPAETTESPIYTPSQVAELIRVLVDLDDPRIREIIRMKIETPDISLSTIGRKYKISKQAIRKDIKLAVRYCPALSVVLCNRPLYNRWRSRIQTGQKIRRRKAADIPPGPMFQMTFEF